MSEEPEPTRDELLDATPEARAMARARAERAARAARLAAGAEEEVAPKKSNRRKAVIGGILLLLAGVRVLERAVRTRAN